MIYHFLCNYSSFVPPQALESFYERFDPDFISIRTKAREVLQREDDLNEIVQVNDMLIFRNCANTCSC